eukprot:1982722-Pyramimonas_sp.AAC.2
MPMLPKAAGGHRLIILYSSNHVARRYWGAASGRSAIDSAWKLSARAEARVSKFRHTATLIAVYSKYYETIELAQ